jgi:hypothetical protein
MPPSLQTIAKGVPLTYVNEGLREAMIMMMLPWLAISAEPNAVDGMIGRRFFK